MSDKVETTSDRYAYGKNRPGNASVAYVAETQLRDMQKSLPLRVLSEDDWKHWITRGYVVVKQAVPPENVKRLVDLLWEFQEMNPNDPSTWYRDQLRDHAMKELNNSGMVEIYNHQYLWDNRQYPRVYDAFLDVCLEEWRKTQPANRDPWKPDTTGFEIVPVMPKAGDLLIFNSLLAHGIRPNTSKDKVRIAQYISMTPADESREDLREIRVRSWREMEPPQGFAFPGDPRAYGGHHPVT